MAWNTCFCSCMSACVRSCHILHFRIICVCLFIVYHLNPLITRIYISIPTTVVFIDSYAIWVIWRDVLYAQFPLAFYRTIGSYHTQNTDTDTIHQFYSDYPGFTCTCVYVCAHMWIVFNTILSFLCCLMYLPPQSRY